MIVVAPSYQKGQRTSKPAQLLDIFPTLVALADLPVDDSQEGHSLVPLMKDPMAEWPHVALSSFGKGNYAVRSENFRYLRYLDGSEELYDHREDSHEWNNQASNQKRTEVLKAHRHYIPTVESDVLPGKSTGHQAYKAASRFLTKE